MSAGCIKKSNGPTLASAKKLIDCCSEDGSGSIVGEKLKFPHLKNKYGFKVLDITVVEMPSDGDPEYDKEHYDKFRNKAVVRLMVDCAMYNLESPSNTNSNLLKENLKKWFTVREDCFEFGDNNIHFCGVYEVSDKPSFDGKKEVKTGVLFDTHMVVGTAENVISSPFYESFWDPIMNAIISEGVCYSNDNVPPTLRDSIRKNLDKLAAETEIDYHPNSNDIVRDLVHPALFSYVDGVSQFKISKSKASFAREAGENTDFWGRKYEDSIYQWLPTPFQISKNGKCTIKEYINNLSRDNFPDLYDDLEKLFELFLPYFQEVWSYSKAMTFWNNQASADLFDDEYTKINFKKSPVDFSGQELQVITKIVEYKLKPGQVYEGVWHVEGMSHENIVMSGIYFIDRDVDLQGGDLRFKRSFHLEERYHVLLNVPQERAIVVNDFADGGVMPLGRFPTEEGYMLVFPNCHIHKIAKLVNKSLSNDARRRIVVFFVINPNKRIISTAEIGPQQNARSKRIAKRIAKQHRLNLMAERKYDKEKFNTRDIELCEH